MGSPSGRTVTMTAARTLCIDETSGELWRREGDLADRLPPCGVECGGFDQRRDRDQILTEGSSGAQSTELCA